MSTAQHSNQTLNAKSKSIVLSYSTHFADPESAYSQLDSVNRQKDIVLDDLLSLNADIGKLLQSQPDLPKSLARIDVETFLPKLACLPPAGFGADDMFSTRTSIDAIFHSSKRNLRSGTIDVLATGTNSGKVNLRFFDAFEVGDIDLNTAIGLPKGAICTSVRHIASHPFSGGCFVICELSQPRKPVQLHVLNLDLKIFTQNFTTLPILATKATQLDNLLRYLKQIQTQLVREVKAAFELPARFLSNLNEDLERQDGEGSTFINAAHHTIVTGEITPALKEWLSDQLGERGVKRWEKAVGDCLELVRRLIGESWNPAVERLGIVVSRLNGLVVWNAQTEGDGQMSDIEKKGVESLRETIDVMAICGEELLRDVNQEFAGFTSFVKWLKWEVEAAGLEDTSERLDEMREGSDHTDILHVLEYIESGPANTAVKRYIGPSTVPLSPGYEEEAGFYERFKESRRKSGEHKHIVTFDVLLARMQKQCEKLFEQIASTLRRSIMVQYTCLLPQRMDQQVAAVRVVPQPEYGNPKIHFIGRVTDTRGVLLHTIIDPTRVSQREASSAIALEHSLRVPDAEDIIDVKFVDDTSFVVLSSAPGEVQLYTCGLSHDNEEIDDFELRHAFKDGMMESGMKPAKLEVNGRRGRRALTVVDAGGKGYCVFDLDSGDGTEYEEGDGGDIMQE